MTSSPLRLGLFGAGRQARGAHVASLKGFREARITALAAAPDGTAEALAAELGATLCAPEELAARDDVDALIVATPPATHAALVRAAIAANKPVLCELPLATDPREARALFEEAEAAGILHATTLPRPMLNGGVKVAELIATLGTLESATLKIRLPEAAAQGRGDGYPLLAGMAATCLTTLFGPGTVPAPNRTAHAVRNARASQAAHNATGANLEVSLDLALLAPGETPGFTGLEVQATEATLRWSWSQPGHIELTRGAQTEDQSITPEADLGRAFGFTRAFARAILAGTLATPNFEDAAATLELMAALVRAQG